MNSSVESRCRLDYTVTFRDAQDLELIRRKLLKVSLILTSNANVERSLNMYIEKAAQALQQNKTSSSLEMFNQFAVDLEMHKRIVSFLLKKLNETNKLIFDNCSREIETAHSLSISVISHTRASS